MSWGTVNKDRRGQNPGTVAGLVACFITCREPLKVHFPLERSLHPRILLPFPRQKWAEAKVGGANGGTLKDWGKKKDKGGGGVGLRVDVDQRDQGFFIAESQQ